MCVHLKYWSNSIQLYWRTCVDQQYNVHFCPSFGWLQVLMFMLSSEIHKIGNVIFKLRDKFFTNSTAVYVCICALSMYLQAAWVVALVLFWCETLLIWTLVLNRQWVLQWWQVATYSASPYLLFQANKPILPLESDMPNPGQRKKELIALHSNN